VQPFFKGNRIVDKKAKVKGKIKWIRESGNQGAGYQNIRGSGENNNSMERIAYCAKTKNYKLVLARHSQFPPSEFVSRIS